MKLLGKLPAFILGAVAAVAVMYVTGTWQPLRFFGLATESEVEELRTKIAALDRGLLDFEAKIQAEIARNKRAAELRSIEDAMRRAVDHARAQEAEEFARLPPKEIESLFQKALALERNGPTVDAVMLYRRLANAGYSKAAFRLAEIYERGAPAISRSHAESQRWFERGRQLRDQGEPVRYSALKAENDARWRAEVEAAAQARLVQLREAEAAAARKAADDARKAREDANRRAAAEPRKAMSRSERERQADEEAARKALAAAGKAPGGQSAAPSSLAPATRPAAHELDALYMQALAMESDHPRDAVRAYRGAARAGSGKAAKRLGEIFDHGIPGVPRDYAESLQWFETARQLGETVEISGKR